MPAKKKAAKKKAAKKKGFTDYQRKGGVTGSLPDFFKYVPDAGQVSDWLVDQIPKKKTPKKKAAKRKMKMKQ